MGVVVELARRGSDLNSGAEKDRVFSSKAVSLGIAFKLKISITFSASTPFGTAVNLFSHNLGYPPVIQAEEGSFSGQMSMAAPYALMVDETRLMFEAPGSSGSVDLYVTIYAWPIGQEYTSEVRFPFERGGSNASDKVVFKVARPGYDIDARDDRHFIINTRNKYLPVHKSGASLSSAGGGVFKVIEHNLGYAPLFWVYYKPNAIGNLYYRYIVGAPFTEVVTGAHRSTTEDIQIYETGQGDYAYIIFKDPIAS